MSQASGASSSGGGGNTGYLTLNYTLVTTTPYVVQTTNSFLAVDSSTSAITIELPDTPAQGRVFIIKDISGNASNNNITITTVSGTDTLDGNTSFIMNSDYESIQVIFDGTSEYNIF